MGITIYIVDDELRAIQYLRKLLAETGQDCHIVGTASNGVKAVPEILRLKPDIVFADMSMPVMDGLQMSQEILQKNPEQKIIVLTAYKSFDFVQRSIKIGVTDYLLKNELNSRMLKELLEKMEGVLDSDGEKQSLIRQHNYKQFLLSESGKEVYPNIGKKRERIVAVSFMLPWPIWLNVRKNPAKRKEISCYELEKLDYPEGAACRCIVEMNVNEFAGIFCLEEFIADESGVIRRAVECIQERLAQIGLPPFSYVVSETTYTPLDIPTRYREVRRLQNYLYRFGTAYGKGGIYWQSGLRDKREAAEPMDGRRAAFLEMVQEENFEAAREELSKIFELAKRGRDVWEYAEEMKNIVRNLNEYVARNHVNVEEYEMAYEHENTQSLEDMIMGYLGEISESRI